MVLDKNHADFQVAQDIAELINSRLSIQTGGGPLARAINQVNVEVFIPPQYREDPVLFVSQVLSLPIMEPQTAPRVVINERAGSIVISGDVEIGAAVVSHKNIVVETGNAGNARPFVPVNSAEITADQERDKVAQKMAEFFASIVLSAKASKESYVSR